MKQRPITHGARQGYLSGCRCAACREANTVWMRTYRRARSANQHNPIVSAERARAHLRSLRRAGIGRRAVAATTDITSHTIWRILNGRTPRIYARTEAKILRVTPDCASDGALVDAGPTWARIRELLDEGYSVRQINEAMGYSPEHKAVPLGKRFVTVRNAARVERLHRRWTS